MIRRRRQFVTRTVRIQMRTMLRWITEFEQNAKELAGGFHPDSREEIRETAATRAAVLRYVVKSRTRELPKGEVKVRVKLD
jgi:hypothetical protein